MRIRKRGVESVDHEGLTASMFDHEEESSVESWMQEKVDEGDGSRSVRGGSSDSDSEIDGDGAVGMYDDLYATAPQMPCDDVIFQEALQSRPGAGRRCALEDGGSSHEVRDLPGQVMSDDEGMIAGAHDCTKPVSQLGGDLYKVAGKTL